MARTRLTTEQRERRDAEIRASEEHPDKLAKRYNLSRSSVYRIKGGEGTAAVPESYADTRRNSPRISNRQLLFRAQATSGLSRFGGTITQEFQRELQGGNAVKTYAAMAVHPVVSATLLAIDMTLRSVGWYTEPISDRPEDKEVAEFIDGCRADMGQAWAEVVSQIFTMLRFGFSLGEIVYKKRLGQNPPKYVEDPARSLFDDGMIGWRRWQFISPASLYEAERWIYDEYGRIQGVNQTSERYTPVPIPIEKLLLWRTVTEWDNPEGRSILRPMYQSWYYATELAEVEAISAERMGAGFPVIYLGRDTSKDGPDSDFSAAQDMVRNVRVDEQMGLVITHPKMGAGAPEGEGILFELVSSPSRGGADFDKIITRHEQRMAMSALAQFIFLGMTRVGTQALGETTVDFFTRSVSAWADIAASVINRFAIPRLLALSPRYAKLNELPQLKHSDLDVPDLVGIADYINKLVGAQVLLPHPALERHLLEIAELPVDEGRVIQLTPPKVEGEEPEEGAEAFALRLKRGGPTWERSTNGYQLALQDTWRDWARKTARELADEDDDGERRRKIRERTAAVVAALLMAGRSHLPRALEIGLGGVPPSPDALLLLANEIRQNELYLVGSLQADIIEKFERALAEHPEILTDEVSLRALLETFTARVGLYAGTYWVLVQRGLIDKVKQRPDATEVRVAWVLDPGAKHCEECPSFAGEYDNYDALLAATGGRVPGQAQCNGNCRCSLAFEKAPDSWARV
jgi:hypothetical protein